jgi:hypothetical protein
MSADNCIAFLSTPKKQGSNEKEYRVIHCQAIDNIYYDVKFAECYNRYGNPIEVVNYFGKAIVIDNYEEALNKATKLELEIGYTEYGINYIELPHPFSYYIKNAKKPKKVKK